MKKYSFKKFTIILKEIQAGATITETCRKHNKNSGIKNLKAENDKLMRLIIDQALDIQALRRY